MERQVSEIRTLCDLPDDVVPLVAVEVVEYLDHLGERRFSVRLSGDVPLSTTVGLLRIAEQQIIAEAAEWPLP